MAHVDRDRLWRPWPDEQSDALDEMEGFSPLRAAVPFAAIGLIAVLGVGFWILVGSLFGAILGTRESLSGVQLAPPRYHLTPTVTPRPTLAPLVIGPGALTPIVLPSIVAVPATNTPIPTPGGSATPTVTSSSTPTVSPTPTVTTTSGTPTPTPTSGTPTATASPAPSGRDPWILLPIPEPNSRVSSGAVAIEARGRGDAPIREIRLEVDGRLLAVEMDQRSDVIWRARATANLTPGTHEVRARVTDVNGRTGGYRWSFEVTP